MSFLLLNFFKFNAIMNPNHINQIQALADASQVSGPNNENSKTTDVVDTVINAGDIFLNSVGVFDGMGRSVSNAASSVGDVALDAVVSVGGFAVDAAGGIFGAVGAILSGI